MGNEIRTEFEQYVKKLTTAICKEIYLEKLEEICDRYVTITSDVSEASNTLLTYVKNAESIVSEVDTRTKKSEQKINDNIVYMEKSTQELFEEMRKMNAESKQDFIIGLSDYIEKYKRDIAKTLDAGYEQISSKLADIITPEMLQDFADKLEQNTRESKTLAEFVNGTYKAEIEQSIKAIVTSNMEAQEIVNASISAHVQKVLLDLEQAQGVNKAEFNKQTEKFYDMTQQQLGVFARFLGQYIDDEKRGREEALNKQKELIEKIEPNNERMTQFIHRISELERIVEKLEKENDENNIKLRDTLNSYMKEQKALEQKRHADMDLIERRAEQLSWKIYVSFTNTVLVCLFVVLIALQKPWEIYGVEQTVYIAGGFLVVMLFVSIFRKVIAKAIVKRQAKKKIKAYQGE